MGNDIYIYMYMTMGQIDGSVLAKFVYTCDNSIHVLYVPLYLGSQSLIKLFECVCVHHIGQPVHSSSYIVCMIHIIYVQLHQVVSN